MSNIPVASADDSGAGSDTPTVDEEAEIEAIVTADQPEMPRMDRVDWSEAPKGTKTVASQLYGLADIEESDIVNIKQQGLASLSNVPRGSIDKILNWLSARRLITKRSNGFGHPMTLELLEPELLVS